MISGKAFIGALGLVPVRASECMNTTLPVVDYPYSQGNDVAVDSQGNIWVTTAGGGAPGGGAGDGNAVWRCAKDGDCKSMMGDWERLRGIAVKNADVSTVFYVSDGQKVKSCALTYHPVEMVSCHDFGSGWTLPRGLAMDTESNVYVADSAGDHQGVWKCSPSADCTLFGDSEGWLHFPPDNVVVDTQGTVYVTSGDTYGDAVSLRRCTSAGVCVDGRAPNDFHWPWHYHIAVAVDSDDNVYMSAAEGIYNSGSVPGTYDLVRCPLGQDPCESLGSFEGGVRMAIDQDGVLYVVEGLSEHADLRRVCLSPAIKDVQV